MLHFAVGSFCAALGVQERLQIPFKVRGYQTNREEARGASLWHIRSLCKSYILKSFLFPVLFSLSICTEENGILEPCCCFKGAILD